MDAPPPKLSSSSNTTLELALEGERLCKNGDFESGIAFLEASLKCGITIEGGGGGDGSGDNATNDDDDDEIDLETLLRQKSSTNSESGGGGGVNSKRRSSTDLRLLSAIYSQLGNAHFAVGNYDNAVKYHTKDLTVARILGDKLGEGKACGNLGNTLKLLGHWDEAIKSCTRHYDIMCHILSHDSTCTTEIPTSTGITGKQNLEALIGKARAAYNLANAYHAKGKFIGRMNSGTGTGTSSSNGTTSGHNKPSCSSTAADPGEYPPEVKECLHYALEFYNVNLDLTRLLDDRGGEGRACGNLGNVHYLLGDFPTAIDFHKKRLQIAQEFGDLNGERRAYTNLGNACVFSGDFEIACDMYLNSLRISKQLEDVALEAQACYSLGNTYTLLRKYELAIEYHLRHLCIAQKLNDRIGEGRAYWSLGNAYSAIGQNEKALEYAKSHLSISVELGDSVGVGIAGVNVGDLEVVLGRSNNNSAQGENEGDEGDSETSSGSKIRRKSMEDMHLIRMTPGANNNAPIGGDKEKQQQGKSARSKSVATVLFPSKTGNSGTSKENMKKGKAPNPMSLRQQHQTHRHVPSSIDEEFKENVGTIEGSAKPPSSSQSSSSSDLNSLFDLVSRYQTERMDDQRCVLAAPTDSANTNNAKKSSSSLISSKKLKTSNKQPSSSSIISQGSASSPVLISTKSCDYDAYSGQPTAMTTTVKAVTGPATTASKTSTSSSSSSAVFLRANSLPVNNKDGQGKSQKSKAAAPLPPVVPSQQSQRQRGKSVDAGKTAVSTSSAPAAGDTDDLLDMIMDLQSQRMDEQRATLPDDEENENGGSAGAGSGPGNPQQHSNPVQSRNPPSNAQSPDVDVDDDFFDMLIRCQSSRLDEQRCRIQTPGDNNGDGDAGGACSASAAAGPSSSTYRHHQSAAHHQHLHQSTVPDEEFFTLLSRLQGESRRMGDQRANIKDDNSNHCQN